MEEMRLMPDGFIDLAICDFPYGLGNRLSDGGGKLKNTQMAVLYRKKDWDVLPESEIWKELFRVSKNQIICGANYFLEFLPSSRGIVCWDKIQEMPTLSSFELIWTSFDKVAKIYRQSSTDLERMHPTQKPVKLYEWLLKNYAKPGDKILDPMMGSQSSRIAAYKIGFDYWGMEKDESYFREGCARFEKSIAMPLFDAVEKPVQIQMF